MKLLKKISTVVLAMVIAVGFMPQLAAPIMAVERSYPIHVEGKQVVESSIDDVLWDGGSVKYDPATNTLTLTNANINVMHRDNIASEDGIYGIRSNFTDDGNKLTIKLVGKNVIHNAIGAINYTTAYGIITYGSNGGVEYTGDGTLDININANDEGKTFHGIEARQAVTMNGAKININMTGTEKTNGYCQSYSNMLTLQNKAELNISTGTNTNTDTYAMFIDRAGKWIDVKDGCNLTLQSENKAINDGPDFTDDTKKLGVYVNTEAKETGGKAWDLITNLSTYKYLKVPYKAEPTPAKVKKANTYKLKSKTVKIKYKKLKKKAKKVWGFRILSKGQGKKTYKIVKVKKAKFKKYFKINKKTGKITVKKKLKKGTYKVKIKGTAAGDDNHEAKTLTITAKIKVKK